MAGLGVGHTAEQVSDTAAGSKPPFINKLLRKAAIPAAKGARVVVVGAGWSGLTMAKYLKRYNPAFDVVPSDLIKGIITEKGIYDIKRFRRI